jgi:tRNA pseudouridine32 synthase/23S rRNA pseudouridine746 synthase
MAQGMKPVFEHVDFFVFDKPAGASFHSEDGTGFFALVSEQYSAETLYPIHRLDKITSGLVLIARNKTAAQRFGVMFESRLIRKTYIALSDKKPSKKQGTISGDMQRTRDGNWKLLHSKKSPAITRFTSHSSAPNLRIFILKPETGKTHQLRVMMKALGSPIIGDARYGGTPSDRGYLHAAALQFGWSGENITCLLPPNNGNLFDKTITDVSRQLEAYGESGY